MKFCEKCGEVRNDEFKFCNKCGSLLIVKEEPEAPADTHKAEEGPKCPNCGKVMPVGSLFCRVCGTRLDGSQPKPEPKPEQPAVQPEQQPPQREKKRSNAPIIILIIIMALILTAGCLLTAAYFIKDLTPVDLVHRYILQDEVKDDEEDEEEEDATEGGSSTIGEDEYMDEAKAGEGDVIVMDKAEDEEKDKAEPAPTPTPEPTPTPYVWEDWDIDKDAEQRSVDEWAGASRNNKEHYTKKEYNDAYFYIQDGTPVIIGGKAGVNGWKYNREYVGVEIFFVELDDGYSVVQRFYYSGGRLFRVIDGDGTIHDYGCDGWEEYDEIGKRLAEDRETLLKDYKW